MHDFLTDRRSSIFGVRAAPGGLETFQKGGGEAPYFSGRYPGRQGPPRPPKISDLQSVKKSYSKNPGVDQRPEGKPLLH